MKVHWRNTRVHNNDGFILTELQWSPMAALVAEKRGNLPSSCSDVEADISDWECKVCLFLLESVIDVSTCGGGNDIKW